MVIIFIVVGLSSCKKEIVGPDNNSGTPETPASEYIVSNLSMSIPAEGGDCSFSFKTTDAWTASVINGRADGWLTFSPTSGLSGNVTVTVTASKNESYEDRSATLRIVSGKNTTDLLITQKQKDALLVNATKYEVPEDGGDVSIEVKSNVNYDYTLEDADGWLTENTAKTRAMETRTLSFVVSPNESTDRREGRIVFTDGNLKEVVSIYQGAAKAPEKPDPRILLSKKDITIESKGGTVKIEAVSGKNVSIKIPEGYGWIQEGNKESTNTFYLTVSENNSLDNREGFVSFTDAESGFSENVNILQLSKDAIVVSKSSYSFGLEGGTLAMEVVSNMQVNASSDADWLSLAKSKAVDSQLVFSIAGAEAGTDRTGVITLRSGSAVQKISVRQFPMDSPIVFECKAVKDRLVELFDADCDGELSYKEAAEITTLMNVFNDRGKPSVNLNSITAFDELQYFTSLTEIAPFAFAGTERLNKITLPSGVKVIGEYAFSAAQLGMGSYEQGVRGLDTIALPEGLEEIGRAAFAGRPLNNGVVFPSTLKTIERDAFSNCCYYPNGNAYDVNVKCIGLKKIILPETVERVYGSTFEGCYALESVEIPSSIRNISLSTFSGCSNLINIDGIENVTEIGDGGLLNCGKLLARFKVPASVKQLGNSSLSASRSVIEFQSLVPPRIVNPDNKNDAAPFHFGAIIYVPDIAYKRYHEANYGWNNIETRKLSELYATPVFHTREFDKQNSLGENRHVLRITEEGKDEDEYHYDFIKVEAGSFKRKVPETPSETVTVNITKDYYIAATEFPQWLWIDVMHFNPSEFTNTYLLITENGNLNLHKGESDFRPVERVSWEESNAFLQEFNKLTGLSMRLPTEAEWEYAARGGKYCRGYAYSGSNELKEVAWCQYNSNDVTHPCGLKLANELGLYDMHGNVREHCQDFYED